VYSFGFPTRPNETNAPHFCSPLDPDFKELKYSSKIPTCHRKVSSSLKKRVYDEYGIAESDRTNYTVDHIIPLFLGGSNHRLNLWPQHKQITTAPREASLYWAVVGERMHPFEAINELLMIKFTR
jgi:hypothetical protein